MASEDQIRDWCHRGNLDNVKHAFSLMSAVTIGHILRSDQHGTGTPLFEAILGHSEAVVEYLISFEDFCDIEQECELDLFYPLLFKGKCTPLGLAIADKNLAIVKILLDAGASVSHSSAVSPLKLVAASSSSQKITELLLEYGADVTEMSNGNSALHIACENESDNVELVKLFLKYEADVNQPTGSGETPAFLACMNGNLSIAMVLFKHPQFECAVTEKVKLLQLLGAQCLHLKDMYDTAVRCWHMAFKCSAKMDSVERLASKVDDLVLEGPVCRTFSSRQAKDVLLYIEPIKDSKDLNSKRTDKQALKLQAQLFLNSILGPDHIHTMTQLSAIAHNTLAYPNIRCGVYLYLNIIRRAIQSNKVSTAADILSQLIQKLLNIFTETDIVSRSTAGLVDPLVGTIAVAVQMMHKLPSEPEPFHKQKENLVEQIENIMAILGILNMISPTPDEEEMLITTLSNYLKLGHQCFQTFKLNIEFESLRISISESLTAKLTLYFFQEALFPAFQVTKWLVQAGASVNCSDYNMCTPLTLSLMSSKPNRDLVHYLLQQGAHIDVKDRNGFCPYSILQKNPTLGIQPLEYTTLKCLASRVIMQNKINYRGEIPASLEEFLLLHYHYAPC